jgi:orotidine-5'-phosphate decarboxylase
METTGRIYIALDGLEQGAARQLVGDITNSPHVASIGAFKIHDLWDRQGPDIVRLLKREGALRIWVDLKLHDVPKTVGLRAGAVGSAGADIITVHASGGIEMMRAAVEEDCDVLAITVLTSLTEEETHLLCGQPAKAAVLQRARMAKLAGVWGIVCSAHEVGVLAKQPELKGLKRVVPGIRLGGKGVIDANQKRVDSPAAAFEAGADYIVVGSEITSAKDPIAVLGQIVDQLASLPDRE